MYPEKVKIRLRDMELDQPSVHYGLTSSIPLCSHVYLSPSVPETYLEIVDGHLQYGYRLQTLTPDNSFSKRFVKADGLKVRLPLRMGVEH